MRTQEVGLPGKGPELLEGGLGEKMCKVNRVWRLLF
jgi:hypothetical protein